MKRALAGITMLAALARADSWLLPTRQKYFSPDKTYRVEVIPKALTSQLQYFEDKVNGNPNAGAANGSQPATARAIFSVRGSLGRYRTQVRFPLANEVAPVDAIVSGDGKFLATFDNWHGTGYGDNVVVIYRTDGTVIAKFGLEHLFTAEDIETFPKTVSSIWWGGKHRFNDRNQLVLQYAANGRSEFGELAVDLATGKPVEPKRHLLSKLHPAPPKVRLLPAGEPLPAISADQGSARCSDGSANGFDATGLIALPSEGVVQSVNQSPLPFVCPVLARAARVQGTVVADILLDAAGKVACARIRSAHPLFRTAALDGLLALQVDRALVPGPAISSVTIEFLLAP